MVVGLYSYTTRGATKRRAGIDVISSSDPWRARMNITLICGQLGGPGMSGRCVCVCIKKILGGFELVAHSIYYDT